MKTRSKKYHLTVTFVLDEMDDGSAKTEADLIVAVLHRDFDEIAYNVEAPALQRIRLRCENEVISWP